jgi:hypothetical protein
MLAVEYCRSCGKFKILEMGGHAGTSGNYDMLIVILILDADIITSTNLQFNVRHFCSYDNSN